MRNMLALVGAGTITFVGLGWYLDWYKLERQPAPAGYQRLQLDINPKKIGEDVQAGIERGAELISSLRKEPHAPEQTPAATIVQGGLTAPLLPDRDRLASTPVSLRPTAPATTNNGWRPIGTTPTTRPYDDDPAKRFNIRPLPVPR